MNILTQPPAISGAFNPLLLELQQGNETSADITINVDGNTYELSREYLNGKARYNLTELIKSGFKNEQTTVIENIFIDKLLQVEFGSTQTGASFNSTAIRAVSQRRGQYDMTPLCGTFLTGFHELKKYKNYPLFVSFLTFPNTTYINLNGITLNENSFTQKHLTLSVPDGTNTVSITTEALAFALADNLNDPITTNAGVEIVVSTGLLEPENKTTGIDQPCNPVSPFYIRWINRLGGWDCWMFKNRQFQKSELTKTETSYPAIEDYENGP
ncbi:MAG: hypothetical protein LBG15_09290, partial [Dysgonamonadaceae bacterium]|nr:hypothetical protein [Dysgonamonadaceae bacterium]